MKLSLVYKENTKAEIHAAIISGNNPETWLREINSWNIDPQKLTCFLLPQSLKSVEAVGLFILFDKNEKPEFVQLLNPYQKLSDNLFIPLHSQLYPPTLPEELAQITLWEHQIFHPHIGLIGFSNEDQINFESFIRIGDQSPKNWNYAKAGMTLFPLLSQISIPQPSPEEIIERFKETFDSQGIENLPEEEKDESSFMDVFRDLGIDTLKGALDASKKLRDVIDDDEEENAVNNSPNTSNSESGFFDNIFGGSDNSYSPGLLDRFDNWASKQLNDLMGQRNKEINRLMDLFKKNPEEALKYALPLDSPYENRGQSNPSGRLGRRNTNFNLNRLGGGQATDGWDLPDDQYFQLRRLYQEQAEACLKDEDYRKAAYIYAHLLGDFALAANALAQGKFFREAAVMYKDHLKNPELAAKCLENGGLIPEAIDIYLEMNRYEKAADLSELIGREKAANRLYQKCYDEAISRDDYLDAVRILGDKLKEEENIGELLLEGWNKSSQRSACLRKYFEVYPNEDLEELAEELNHVFRNRTRAIDKNRFLIILQEVNAKHNSPEVNRMAEEIAFKVIDENIRSGKLDNINILGQFFKEDKFINSDISRYKYHHKKHGKIVEVTPLGTAKHILSFKKNIKWQHVTGHLHQFLAVGIENNKILIARGNKEGVVEYFSWPGLIEETAELRFFHSNDEDNKIALFSNRGKLVSEMQLSLSEDFPYEVNIIYPNWLSDVNELIGLGVSPNYIVALSNAGSASEISKFNLYGSVKQNFTINDETTATLQVPKDQIPQKILYHNLHLYTINGQTLIRIKSNPDAKTKVIYRPLLANAKDFILSYHSDPMILISTDEGCLLFSITKTGFEQIGSFFGQNIELVGFDFISNNMITLAGRNEIMLFEIQDEGTSISLSNHYEVTQNIQYLVSSYVRGQITAFTEEGEIISF